MKDLLIVSEEFLKIGEFPGRILKDSLLLLVCEGFFHNF
jgi:hypothetical protein